MDDEVKHCVLDPDDGAFVLCDSCYLADDRRYGWEHRANPFPGKRGRTISR